MESMSNQAILSIWRRILIDCFQLEESHRNLKPLFHIWYLASMPLRAAEVCSQSWSQPFYRLSYPGAWNDFNSHADDWSQI